MPVIRGAAAYMHTVSLRLAARQTADSLYYCSLLTDVVAYSRITKTRSMTSSLSASPSAHYGGLGISPDIRLRRFVPEVFEVGRKGTRPPCVHRRLLHRIRTLNDQREQNPENLRASDLLVERYQELPKASKRERDALMRASKRDPFVLILVDGDITLFKDSFVQDGVEGGERAARALRQALFDYFEDKPYFKHDHKIVTKIYSNHKGLAGKYIDAGVTQHRTKFLQFVRGFNGTHDLMEILDAGDGRQAADHKVRAQFDLFRCNLHCKQIVIAGSGDGGYGHLLRPYVSITGGKSETITLIRALPFAWELQHVSDKFETTSFDELFRDTKLDTGRVVPNKDVSRSLLLPTSAPNSRTSFMPSRRQYRPHGRRSRARSRSDNETQSNHSRQLTEGTRRQTYQVDEQGSRTKAQTAQAV